MSVSAIILPTLFAMWPLLTLVALVMMVVALIATLSAKKEAVFQGNEALAYEKKPYVFDIMSELSFYRMLLEMFGEKYYVFPQVGYSHLIQLRKGVPHTQRNRFDKKSADFVLCDKVHAIARVVIELDGASHQTERKIGRDAKVDRMMQQIGLPIVHINPSNLNKDHVRTVIESVLK